MKTTLLHLEAHDDLISVRDRMAWAKTPRILLIWPRRARQPAIRPLDLTLLRRQAAALGAQLALVTRRSEIRSAARRLQIPCFSNLAQAQKQPWESLPPAPRPARRKIDLRRLRAALPGEPFSLNLPARIGVFAAGVFALLLIFFVFLPSAKIRLETAPRPQQLELSLSADPAASGVTASGEIPARPLILDLEISASAPATGLLTLPGARAEAEVLLTNLSAAPVTLPAGSILLTRARPPLAFETLSAVQVEKTASVRVRALQGGAAGNVPAGEISAFQGSAGLALSVTNPQPASGGEEKTQPAPSAADRQKLRADLLAQLRQRAPTQFSAALQTGDFLLEDSIQPGEILLEEFSPPPGAPGETLSLRLRVRFRAFFAAQTDLTQMAARALDAALPPDFLPRPGSLELTPLSAPRAADGVYRWQMRAARAVQPRLDVLQAALLARGQSPRRAAQILAAAYPLSAPPLISNSPLWWPWLPFLPLRISVSTNFP
ncbi:MAG: hypothetical protein Fur0035_06250 [Anaerolineales bacterium]